MNARVEQILILPVDTLPGHGPDTRMMREYAERAAFFEPGAEEGSWLARGRGVTFEEMVELAAKAVDPAEPVDLAVTVAATADCGDMGYPGSLLGHLLPGRPTVLGLADQGVAGPFTAVRVAADRIARGDAGRAVVLVLEQCRVPSEVRPARDRAVLVVLGGRGTHAVEAVEVRRGAFDGPPRHRLVTSARGEIPGDEGATGVWAALAERWPDLAGTSVTVRAREEGLGYGCRLDLAASLPGEPR
ncbi:hypothetical protein ABH931_000395 [Streptacidiphilus sp. MAP12-33]|uniref:hypothetical protein n=1 Tax=Streptacidiphilus sp. MAP12-33 TaxID=3156266 RepID=UPI003517F6F7